MTPSGLHLPDSPAIQAFLAQKAMAQENATKTFRDIRGQGIVRRKDLHRFAPRPWERDRRGARGSGLTNTWSEVIYSNPLVGTAKTTFTSEFQINDTAGMGPQPILPPYFFMPSRSRTVMVRVVARGIYSTTAAPTWQHFCRFNTAGASIAGPNVGSETGLIALGSTQTNLLWEFEEDVQLTLEGAAGANSTLRGLGLFTAALTTSTSLTQGVFGGAASPGTVATFSIDGTTYITFSVACGTSSASNSIQLLQLLIMGMN